MKFNEEVIKKISDHALQEYPFECCGIITGDGEKQTVHPCTNTQNRQHAEDPELHPRDARTAYLIDRKELNGIITAANDGGETILAFYHSHPEHEAYFSEDDLAAQTVFGEPEFPDAQQIVISVMAGKVHDIQCFQWDRQDRVFRAVTS